MSWRRGKRFQGLNAAVICLLGALWCWIETRSNWNTAVACYVKASNERNRIERLVPHPSEENVTRARADAAACAEALNKLKQELGERMLPLPAFLPSEFQSALRISMDSTLEKARAKGVKLPNRFCLGFDEFTAALPGEKVAPLLGHELTQVEWLVGLMIDARISALVSFDRAKLPEESDSRNGLGATPRPGVKPPISVFADVISRNAINLTFTSTPAALRRIVNEISSDPSQFCIIRRLHVRNEREKGPAREAIENSGVRGKTSASAELTFINYIVGEEQIETSAVIEFVMFNL